MARSRFDVAKKNINSFFDDQESKIFTFHHISEILESQRQVWGLPAGLRTKKFIELLSDKTKLKITEFSFPSIKIIRYSWGDVSIFNLVSTLKENSYFTHYSAMYLNNLTEQIPKTIYLNFEQPSKIQKRGRLLQENIDRAFSRSQRISKNIATVEDYNICLLNGQFTNNLGVIELNYSEQGKISVTNIERTLIDITVRSSYAGGVFEVLKAFKNAKDKVSINKLSSMLKKLNYIYPYHQAIGYYIEKAGNYNDAQIELLREKFKFERDFYLTYQMKDTKYSKKWRLYYPNNF
ncbi:MAG: hypothetical protein ABSE95_06945 [Thermodesulfobacteriota bacterium]|jgi:predicted transcriptional regulator of viral defense system